MLLDIIDLIDFDLQKAVIDNYSLKEGLYVCVGENIEYFIYKKPKKPNKDKDKLLYLEDLEGNIRSDMYEWFCRRDYLSGILSTNKSIDSPKKKIHSNNYLSFFIKAKEWSEENKTYFDEKLDVFKTFSQFKKKQEKEVIKTFKDYIFNEERLKDFETKKAKLFSLYNEIMEIITQKEILNYVKLFFDEDIEKYKNESQIYYALKIYNKIETIHLIDNKIYGLSDFNMGLNQKKPFLEHKTKSPNLPFLVEKENIFQIKELFDYLHTQNKKTIEFNSKNFKIIITKQPNNDQAEIIDFDIVSKKEGFEKIVIKNFTLAKEKGEYINELIFRDRDKFLGYLNEILYQNTIFNNLHDKVYNKLDNQLQNLIYLTRDLIKNYQKGDNYSLETLIKKFGFEFIQYQIKQGSISKSKKILNLIISLKGLEMNIEEKLNEIEEAIKNSTTLNSEDFYILTGQVIKFLLDKSNKSDKKADMIEPFLRANNAKKLKKEVEGLFFKYKHEIYLNSPKFNNALALVMAYEGDEKIKKDKLLIGILTENIFYRKDNK